MSIYKSQSGHQAITAWYEKKQEQHGYHSRKANTPFGETHIIAAGEEHLPDVLLLPGTNFSALSWHGYIEALSRDYHVHAVDIVGQPGKSGSQRPSFREDAYAEWLLAVLDACDIERVSIVGHSLGAWLGLKLATATPEKVARLVLINPGGLIGLRVSPRILLRSIAFVLFPNERTSANLLQLMSVQSPPADMVTWMTLVGRHVKSSLAPPPLPADDLKRVEADTLLLTGDEDAFIPAEPLVQRAHKALDNPQVVIVPGSGHLLPHEREAACIEHIRAFLSA